MKRIKRSTGIATLVLFVLIVSIFWIAYSVVQQSNLDYALIQAIKAEDEPKILEALEQGANAESRETGKEPSVRQALLLLLDRIQYKGGVDPQEHLPALLLLYVNSLEKMGAKAYVEHEPGPSMSVVRALLDHGAQVNDGDMDHTTALHYASQFSNADTVALLLERGANIEARDTDTGHTPLMGAGASVTKVLLDHGANIEAANKWQVTVLMYAAENADTAVVRILLEHGEKVGRKDINGETALDYLNSSKQGTPEDRRKVADLLRRYGLK